MGNREEDAAPAVLEGTVVQEDIIRAALRAAGFPAASPPTRGRFAPGPSSRHGTSLRHAARKIRS